MFKKTMVCIGTYTNKGSDGIYTYQMDQSSGELEPISTTKGVVNPSFLADYAPRNSLYAVNEIKEFEGNAAGTVSSFMIDSETGKLIYLNKRLSLGTDPCYLSIDKTGRYTLVANYSSGSVSVLPIQKGGHLGDATDHVQHKGSSVNRQRQQGPHAHCIILDPTNRYALVADLGLDKILIYEFDSESGKLSPNDEPYVKVKPGSGPRHLTFHPNGRFIYLINELGSTIITYSYDATRGSLEEVQTVSAVPWEFNTGNYGAEIHVVPSGRFLYASNRGCNCISIFRIDENTGRLMYVGKEPTGGIWPRSFAIDPTGSFLIVANQHTDNVTTFRMNSLTGDINPAGSMVKVPTPTCVRIIPPNSHTTSDM